MIFASLGTMDMAFVRMAKAIDEWAATTQEEVIVQTGYTTFNYRHAKAFDFCTKDEMQQYIKAANILILQVLLSHLPHTANSFCIFPYKIQGLPAKVLFLHIFHL